MSPHELRQFSFFLLGLEFIFFAYGNAQYYGVGHIRSSNCPFGDGCRQPLAPPHPPEAPVVIDLVADDPDDDVDLCQQLADRRAGMDG